MTVSRSSRILASSKTHGSRPGLAFRGLSLMPNAIEIEGRALASRREKLMVMTVISDGWPYDTKHLLLRLGDHQ
jgi:hypothetical protein